MKIFQNGAVIKCPGLFHGEIIVEFENSKKSIIFAMIAPNPDLEYVTTVFNTLIGRSFKQCIRALNTMTLKNIDCRRRRSLRRGPVC
jgi:hypothetical protein